MQVLRDVRLELTERQIQRVMAEADENDYGMIEYAKSNFIAVAVRLISMLHSMGPLPPALASAPVDVLLGRALHREDFDRMLEDAFFSVDPHNSGVVSRSELRRALTGCAIGLTAPEINVLMFAAEESREGLVAYADYLPKCFDAIRTYTLGELAVHEVTAREWEAALLDVFTLNDADKTGLVHRTVARNLLMRSGLALTHLWIYAILGEVDEDAEGRLRYAELARSAGAMLAAANSIEGALQLAWYVRKWATAQLGEEQIKTYLKIAFGGTADMTRAQVVTALRAGGDVIFTQRETNALLSTVSESRDGVAECDGLVALGYDVIKFMAFRACAAKGIETVPARPTARSEAADAVVAQVDASLR